LAEESYAEEQALISSGNLQIGTISSGFNGTKEKRHKKKKIRIHETLTRRSCEALPQELITCITRP